MSDFQTTVNTGKEIFLEAMVGQPNYLPVAFLEQGALAQKSVARIVKGGSFATGFLVSSSLLMTNNHVLPSSDDANDSTVEFNFQEDIESRPLKVEQYKLDPESFFYTNQSFDFTLVRVKGDDLSKWGFLPLIKKGALRGEACNIVQHPEGEFKRIVLQDSTITNVFENVVLYTSDTEIGSSGSPVFDNRWRVVALHHGAGTRLMVGGNKTWIDNEGSLITTIISDLRKQLGNNPEGRSILLELGIKNG